MKIVVCVKQVPASNEVEMDKETNTLIRENTAAVINPYDLHALEAAVKIKNQIGAEITALSMGIPAVEELLKKAVAHGVDEGILLTDRAFAGADSLATSYTLAQGIKKIKDYDLIICGKQATDGDTAQVGPGLAEKLGIPHLTYVRNIKKINQEYILCERKIEERVEIIRVELPALITVTREINKPGFPSIAGMIRAQKSEITFWNAEDLGADKSKIGLEGSPTQVVETYIPETDTTKEMLTGTPRVQAQKLVERLENMVGSNFWS